MNSGIYIIRNLVNNKVYVGSTINFTRRKCQHFQKLTNKKHVNIKLSRAFEKYGGEKFVFEIIQYYPYVEEIKALEDYWIVLLDSKKSGYNIANASFGDTLSDHPNRDIIIEKIREGTKKWRASMSEEERANITFFGERNGMFGKKHSPKSCGLISEGHKTFKKLHGHGATKGIKKSDEHRKKLSDIAKNRTGEKNSFFGRTHSDETKKKIGDHFRGKRPANAKYISIDGTIYSSTRTASEALGVYAGTLYYRANSKNFPNIFWINELV